MSCDDLDEEPLRRKPLIVMLRDLVILSVLLVVIVGWFVSRENTKVMAEAQLGKACLQQRAELNRELTGTPAQDEERLLQNHRCPAGGRYRVRHSGQRRLVECSLHRLPPDINPGGIERP